MAPRASIFLQGLLLLPSAAAFSVDVADDGTCDVASGDKMDCAYSGIDQNGCEQKGCCWDPVNPNPDNEPWCHYKSDHKNPCKNDNVPNWNADSPGFTDDFADIMKKNFEGKNLYYNLN